VWAYVLILIIGVAVTVAGVRLGRRRREDPFADVTTPDGAASDATTSEPVPFTSHREPAPLGGAEAETAGSPGAPTGRPAPRATLEERLREARDARAAQHDDARSADASAKAETPVEPSAPDAVGEGAARPAGASAAATGSRSPAAPSAGAAGSDPALETTPPVEAEATELDPEAETAGPAPAATEPIREPVTRRALAPEVREDFAQRWTPIRMRLLARPAAAVGDADAFVRDLLAARGLPNDPDDPAMAEASNAYPDVIDPFRLATAIARTAEDGTADPQQLRLATVHYRDAVERLLAGDDLPVA
jgi:hypothetical protein